MTYIASNNDSQKITFLYDIESPIWYVTERKCTRVNRPHRVRQYMSHIDILLTYVTLSS